MTEIILITFVIAFILVILMAPEFGILESVLAVLITLIFIIPLEIVIYNKANSWDKEQKEYLNAIITHIKKGKPVICYEGVFSGKGILIKTPKLIKDNKILSEDGKVFSIWNCDIIEKGGIKKWEKY